MSIIIVTLSSQSGDVGMLSITVPHPCLHLRLVRVLLEQVVSSTIERCVEVVLMEQSVSYL